MKKIIKVVFFSVVAVVLLFFASLFVFSNYYGEKIKAIVVEELNKQLSVKIEVRDVEFSFFKRFPDASIEFYDIIVHSSGNIKKADFKQSTDTLLAAHKLFLQFNILDILHEKYYIKTIYVNNSRVNFFVDRQGENNLRVIKEMHDDSVGSSNVKIDLEKVQAENCQFTCVDISDDISGNMSFDNVLFKGEFSSSEYDMSVKIVGLSKKLTIGKQKFPSGVRLAINCSSHVVDSTYTINICDVQVNDIEAAMRGKVEKKKYYFLDLGLELEKSKISELLRYLPPDVMKYIRPWKPEGVIELSAAVKGYVSRRNSPAMEVNFSIEKGSFAYENTVSGAETRGMLQTAKLSDPSRYVLQLDTVAVVHNQSTYNGKLLLKDFKSLYFKMSGDVQCEIRDVFDFVKPDTSLVLSGRAGGQVFFAATLSDIDTFDLSFFDKVTINTKLKLQGVSFKDKRNYFSVIQNIDATVETTNENMNIEECTITYFDTRITGSGKLGNVLNYAMFDNQTLDGDLKLKTSCIDYDKMMKDSPRGNGAQVVLPREFHFAIDLETECFNFGKFEFKNLRGNLDYDKGKMVARDLSFGSFGGKINGDLTLNQLDNNGFEITTRFDASNINVDKLFISCDNFGQKELTDQNIKGKFSGKGSFYAQTDNAFQPVSKTILVECSVVISDGHLVNFEPMKKLSSFVDIQELGDISFSTLKNDLVIKDEKIVIPQMDIKSSAFSVLLSGTHQFGGAFEYKVQVYLNELLGNKYKTKHTGEYFGEVKDDGLGRTKLPLLIAGTPGNYKVSYDTKTVKENIKESIKKEKSELSRIIKEEFNFMGNKDSVKSKPKDEPKPKFEIEFE